jgi:hypothetical protein
MAKITYRHSLMRRMLWPMYSIDQTFFTVVMLGLVAAATFLFYAEATFFVVAGCVIAIWGLSFRHAPISARVRGSARPRASEILDNYWAPSARRECWVPRAARWRRWNFVEICIATAGDDIIISGPRSNVIPLIADLEDELR